MEADRGCVPPSPSPLLSSYLTSPPSDSHSHGHGDAVHDTAKKVVAKAKAVVEPEEEEEAAEEPAPKEEEESAPAPEEPKEEKKEAAAAPAATSHSAEDTLPDDAHDLKTASADGPKEVGKAGAASQQAEVRSCMRPVC